MVIIDFGVDNVGNANNNGDHDMSNSVWVQPSEPCSLEKAGRNGYLVIVRV